MDELSELRHGLWIKLRLAAPPRIQSTLQDAKEVALILAQPFLTLYEWQGRGQGGPLTVSYAGFEYAKGHIKSMLFLEEPAEKEIGRVPIWQLGRLADLTDTDLSYVVADKRVVKRLPRQNALVMPYRTRLTLDVRGEWEDVVQRFSRSVRRNELRLVRKYSYTYRPSHSDADFKMFYHSMYVPTMKQRHADLADVMSLEEACQYFRRGVLLLVERERQCVAGVVCFPERKVFYAIIMGVLNGDEELMRKEGAGAALYYSFIHYPNQQGYDALDFWGSKPYFKAMFSYKRKWGATLGIPPDMPQRIWLKVRRNPPAVRRFLTDNPCITLDDEGALWGLIFSDDLHSITPEAESEWHKRYDTPGLSGLLIRSVSDISNPKWVGLQ